MNISSSYDEVFSTEETVFICDIPDYSAISGAFFILICILSVIGNILLICVLVMYENLKNVTNVFVLNLACSDLIFTATLPFWAVYHLHHWIFGDFLCKFFTWAHFIGLYSSVFILTAMTMDRFIIVVLHNWPNNCRRQRLYVVVSCTAAWLISFAASLSDAVKMEVYDSFGVHFCEGPSDFGPPFYVQVSLLFFLPFIVTIFCYCAIIKSVLQSTIKERPRTVAIVLCIVAAFFICWGPYIILLLGTSFYKPIVCKEVKRLAIAYNIFRVLAFSHCCMNPLLYMLSQKLRKHLLHLVSCEFMWRRRDERGIAQNTSVLQNVAFTANNTVVML